MTVSLHRPLAGGAGQWIAWSGVFLLVVALLLPGLLFGASQDAAVYTEVAERLRSGVPPYAGAWDHKPPGVYVVYAVAQSALPFLGAWIPVWIVSLTAIMASGLLTTSLARRGGLRQLALPAGATVAVLTSLPPIGQGGGHTEVLALPFALASILLVVTPRSRLATLAAGALMGTGTLMSLQIVPVGAVALVLLLLNRSSLSHIAAYAAGGVGVVAVAAGILGAFGVLPDAIDAVFTYSAAYREMNAGHQGRILVGAMRAGILVSAPLLFPLGVGFLRAIRVEGSGRSLAIASVVWLFACALWIVFQLRIEGHYLIPAFPPTAILLALGTSRLFSDLRGRMLPAFVALALSATLAALAILVVVAASRVVWNELRAENARVQAVAAIIESGGASGTTVFVWGNRPQLYYESHRHPANKYFYLAPLTTPGYSSERQILEVTGSLRSDPPAYIVDAGSAEPGAPGLPALLIDRPIAANGRDFDALDPLRELVAERYELVGVIDGWPLYQLRS